MRYARLTDYAFTRPWFDLTDKVVPFPRKRHIFYKNWLKVLMNFVEDLQGGPKVRKLKIKSLAQDVRQKSDILDRTRAEGA